MRWMAILALAAMCGGRASVTRGMTDQVQILSEPPGAEARTSMGHACTTPCTLQFNRKDEFIVTASKPGYHTVEMPVATRLASAGAAGFAGNVLLGGVVTAQAADDAAEVAWHKLGRLPPLAFDHDKILACARDHLARQGRSLQSP